MDDVLTGVLMKNYDPRMHSAEHILNQTMDRMFRRGRSFSAHIEKKKSKCDYHFDRGLTDDEVQEIERRVNAIIQENLPVREEFVSRSDAGSRFVLDRLPDDAGETIRIITIGHYDACPCIGKHVSSTGDIGRFRITSTDFGNGVLRIRFGLAE
jgi:misacylated tRNA(Ala) deacylase